MTSLLNRFSDIEAFSKAYGPERQEYFNDNMKSVIAGSVAPTLTVMGLAYGKVPAKQWLMGQLAEFNEFCGKKEKMDDWQIEQLAGSIISRCGQLKATEIMVFLYRYKSGKYGPLYGTVDPVDFMVNLTDKFLPWRAKIAEQIESEMAWKEREQWKRNALKPEQIEELKKRMQQIGKT